MASARVQPSPPVFENQIHNRFRESVYREQGRRGLGPYSINHQTPLGRNAHGGGFRGSELGHGTTTSGAELKRTRNLFEERVRFYLGRGASGKGHLGGLSQAGLANVRRRTTSGVTSRACVDCKKITLSLTGARWAVEGRLASVRATKKGCACTGGTAIAVSPTLSYRVWWRGSNVDAVTSNALL